jgi:hypothetical protein
VRDWSVAGGSEDRRSALHHFCTAPSGTTTPTSAMSTSVGMNAAGYNLLLTVSLIIYIFAYCGRSHFVMNFVSVKFLLLFFWIKLLVKMANIPTKSSSLRTCGDDASSHALLTKSWKPQTGKSLDDMWVVRMHDGTGSRGRAATTPPATHSLPSRGSPRQGNR